MYIITAVNLGIIYYIEKLLFLRVSRSPPALSERLPRMVTGLFLFAAVIHSANGLWMFSNTMFYDPKIEYDGHYVDYKNYSFYEATHNWDAKIDWPERTFGGNSIFLFVIVIVVGGAMVSALLKHIFVDFLGIVSLVKNLIYVFNKKYNCCWEIERPMDNIQPEGNKPYFDAIPLSVMRYRVGTGLLAPDIACKYLEKLLNSDSEPVSPQTLSRSMSQSTEIDADHPSVKASISSKFTRSMEGLETYNIISNPDYAHLFGLETTHIRRVRPTDFLVHDAMLGAPPADSDGLKRILQDCSPSKNAKI